MTRSRTHTDMLFHTHALSITHTRTYPSIDPSTHRSGHQSRGDKNVSGSNVSGEKREECRLKKILPAQEWRGGNSWPQILVEERGEANRDVEGSYQHRGEERGLEIRSSKKRREGRGHMVTCVHIAATHSLVVVAASTPELSLSLSPSFVG